jgi:DNA-binding NarL/FixJ family response regulator
MYPTSEIPSTSVLLIDGSQNQRTYWVHQLKRASPDYLIVEAQDRESGLALYRSREFDCVVLELALPDQSSFQLLVDLVPNASRPQVAVVVLTQMTQRGIWELARLNGAYACFVKEHTTGNDLDKVIQRAVGVCGKYAQGRSVQASHLTYGMSRTARDGGAVPFGMP